MNISRNFNGQMLALSVASLITIVCQFLVVVFVILKLADIGLVASWSWWAVFSPLWVPVVLILAAAFAWELIYASIKVWRR